jgi:hypothetical protein
MKRLFIVLVLILVAAAATYVVFAHLSGGSLPTLGLPLGGEKAVVRERVLSFLEDLRFRDEARAATYFETRTSDRPGDEFLSHIFNSGSERLDLESYEILDIELDRKAMRARVRVRLRVTTPLQKAPIEHDALLIVRKNLSGKKWLIER